MTQAFIDQQPQTEREQCDFVSRGDKQISVFRAITVAKITLIFSLLPLLPLPISRGSHFFALLLLTKPIAAGQFAVEYFPALVPKSA
jgi:hypothetical protein